MAIQVNYPGVYIEEFTPGAPIEGVGTSTAAFIGTATSGPIKKPTLIQSWDAFVSTFGGFIAEQPASYLAPAVYGFFLNGGTACYIVRAGTGVMAWAKLDSRQGGTNPEPILIARALQEGPSGDSIDVQVVETSRLGSMLTKAGSAATTLVLYRVDPAPNITLVSADRTILTVNNNTGFIAGDRVMLTKQNVTAQPATVKTTGTGTIILNAPIGGNANFGGGQIRIANIVPGQQRFRVTVPTGLSLSLALPRGSAIKFSGTNEIGIVESTNGDVITLKNGVKNTYDLAVANPVNLPTIASLEFDLVITDKAIGKSETFEQLAMNPQHPNYWGTRVVSELVTIEEPASLPSPIPDDLRPDAKTYSLSGGTADDRALALTELRGDPKSYLDLLKAYDEVALVCIPGETDVTGSHVQQAIIEHCETMYDRFAILDSKPGVTPGNGIRDQFGDVRSQLGFAGLYYPWILARNPLTGKDELWPPAGHIAGVYARTDQQRGVHKAPANTNIRGAVGVERRLTDEEQGPLNLMGINVIRVFPGQSQPVLWGARTTAGDLDRNWQYVNIRRLFLFLEESIQEGIRWAVFEPNNLLLWQKLKRTITEFLTRVWRDGALFGETADKAFYVRIDEALNPDSTRALGRLYIEIGVRPSYPAEFIIVRIGIWQGGAEVSER